jgi:TP901 family phage tail tape measure protein
MPATAQIRISADSVQFKKAMADVEKSMKNLQSMSQKTTSSIGKLFGLASKVTGFGLFVGLPASLAMAQRSFQKFEKQMLEVYTLLPRANKSAFQKMKQDALSFSEKFGTPTEEVALGMYQSVSAGANPETMMTDDGFMEVAQKSAIAGVTDLRTAVDALTNVVNAYGESTYEMGYVADQMFSAVSMSKTTFRELADYMYQVIPTAASMKVGIDDLLGSISALAATGTLTRVGTTQLRQFLIELSRTGDKANGAFLRGSGGVPVQTFIRNGGRIIDIIKIMGDVAKKKRTDLRNLFSSVEAGNAALSLYNSVSFEGMDATQKAGAEGAMEQAYLKIFNSMDNRINRIKESFFNTFKRLGEALRPVFDDILEYFEGVAKEIRDYDWSKLADNFNIVWHKIKSFLALDSASMWDMFTLSANIAFKTVESFLRSTLQPALDKLSKGMALIWDGQRGIGKTLLTIIGGIGKYLNSHAIRFGVVLMDVLRAPMAFIGASLMESAEKVGDAIVESLPQVLKDGLDLKTSEEKRKEEVVTSLGERLSDGDRKMEQDTIQLAKEYDALTEKQSNSFLSFMPGMNSTAMDHYGYNSDVKDLMDQYEEQLNNSGLGGTGIRQKFESGRLGKDQDMIIDKMKATKEEIDNKDNATLNENNLSRSLDTFIKHYTNRRSEIVERLFDTNKDYTAIVPDGSSMMDRFKLYYEELQDSINEFDKHEGITADKHEQDALDQVSNALNELSVGYEQLQKDIDSMEIDGSSDKKRKELLEADEKALSALKSKLDEMVDNLGMPVPLIKADDADFGINNIKKDKAPDPFDVQPYKPRVVADSKQSIGGGGGFFGTVFDPIVKNTDAIEALTEVIDNTAKNKRLLGQLEPLMWEGQPVLNFRDTNQEQDEMGISDEGTNQEIEYIDSANNSSLVDDHSIESTIDNSNLMDDHSVAYSKDNSSLMDDHSSILNNDSSLIDDHSIARSRDNSSLVNSHSDVANNSSLINSYSDVTSNSSSTDSNSNIANNSSSIDNNSDIANNSSLIDNNSNIANNSSSIDGNSNIANNSSSISSNSAVANNSSISNTSEASQLKNMFSYISEESQNLSRSIFNQTQGSLTNISSSSDESSSNAFNRSESRLSNVFNYQNSLERVSSPDASVKLFSASSKLENSANVLASAVSRLEKMQPYVEGGETLNFS